MKQLFLLAAASLSLIASVGGQCQVERTPKWRVMFETGGVWQGRNSARIPGDTGTFVNLRNAIPDGPNPHMRITAYYELTRTTGFRAVYAPLSIDGTGQFNQNVNFAGANIAANQPTAGRYMFNSYRFTYWYRFDKTERSDWRAGITLKARDARISLQQGQTVGSKYDFGLVLLLHLSGEYRFAPRWQLMVDFDGLAAPMGRAFDLGLMLGVDVSRNWLLTFGYRTLEGGADNKQVYTFSWFNYLTAGLGVRF